MSLDATDPLARAVLETARAWGVSPSTLMGRPRKSKTVYTYDASGRVLTAETTEEPEWTQEDMNGAFSLRKYEAELCPGCKRPLSETADPEHEFSYKAEAPVRCHACTVRVHASEGYRESPAPSALFIPVKLKGED